MRMSLPFDDLLQNYSRRAGRVLLLLVVVAMTTSCRRSSDRVDVYPVQGDVRCQGQPTVGALVVFHPLDTSEKLQKLRPAGTVDATGKYVLSTYEPGDGAPPGKYRVTVIWPSPGQGEHPGPDRFGGRYTNPNGSPLTAAVTSGENHIEPFDLPQK
jgi:hypothetical protein